MNRTIAAICPCGPPSRSKSLWGIEWLSRQRQQLLPSPLLRGYLDQQAHADRPDYLAGNEEQRLNEFRWALASEADTIWIVRGGYGLTKLLPGLPAVFEGSRSRRIVGFSDVTALFEWTRLSHPDFELWHAPNLQSLPVQSESLTQVESWLRGEFNPSPWPLKARQVIPQPIEGHLIGGNLCVLASTCGFPLPDAPKHPTVAFFEDIAEPAYKLDRYWTQLRHSGWFERNQVQAVLLGEFDDCPTAPQIEDIAASCLPGIPIFSGLPVGHAKVNHPVRVGRPVTLQHDCLHF